MVSCGIHPIEIGAEHVARRGGDPVDLGGRASLLRHGFPHRLHRHIEALRPARPVGRRGGRQRLAHESQHLANPGLAVLVRLRRIAIPEGSLDKARAARQCLTRGPRYFQA